MGISKIKMRDKKGLFKEGHTINKTHGMTGTRIYRIWDGMKRRCDNPKMTGYEHYGGGGISYCERWGKFENFYADMGLPPTDRHSIDRIDSKRGYYKENCRWATMLEQAANKKNNALLTLNGETHHQCEWSRITGINLSTMRNRLKRGWPVELVLTKKVRKK